MGKTPLCTDAAEPVAGGATADKYVSRQHHGVAHRAEPSGAAPCRAEAPRAGHRRGIATPRENERETERKRERERAARHTTSCTTPHLPIPLRHFVPLLSLALPALPFSRFSSPLYSFLPFPRFESGRSALTPRSFLLFFPSVFSPFLTPAHRYLPPSRSYRWISLPSLVPCTHRLYLFHPRAASGVRSRAFIHLNIMEMSTLVWTRNRIAVPPPTDR